MYVLGEVCTDRGSLIIEKTHFDAAGIFPVLRVLAIGLGCELRQENILHA